MQREDVTINFKLKNDKWHIELSKGKYKYAAAANSLEDAESKAFEIVDQLPNCGTIHTVYNPGKQIDVAKIPIKDVMIND